ncbi:hypothetical protein PATSB16_36570 [Pandoraea thiooxydans]|nr:DUF4087 domain-containing protein [Pandoraea thiooxydans]APR96993.1 hypothetical protein PATSB16_36570 [Pandoraea thiooxydans]
MTTLKLSRRGMASLALAACLGVALPCGVVRPAEAAQTRCGWLDNPTPGNWWLDDRDGSWTIGTMGGPQAQGIDRIPDASDAQFVATNGPHGYSCACLKVVVDKKDMRVVRILSARQLPLATCRADTRLPKPPQ